MFDEQSAHSRWMNIINHIIDFWEMNELRFNLYDNGRVFRIEGIWDCGIIMYHFKCTISIHILTDTYIHIKRNYFALTRNEDKCDEEKQKTTDRKWKRMRKKRALDTHVRTTSDHQSLLEKQINTHLQKSFIVQILSVSIFVNWQWHRFQVFFPDSFRRTTAQTTLDY